MTRPIHILLVEDNRADVLLVRDALRSHGLDFELEEISDAEQATRYIEQLGTGKDAPRPDIVVLDLNIPKGDGLDLLRRLRTSPQGAETPVIVMTSSDSPRDRARVAEGRATRYFRKPLDLEGFMTLGAVVRDILAERRPPAELS